MSPVAMAEAAVVPNQLVLEGGLPGFPTAHRFSLYRWGGGDSPFSILHSLDIDGLDFVVTVPELFFPNYQPAIDDTTAERLGVNSADDTIILVILTLGESPADATANLLGPVVINRHTLRAAQVVLNAPDYSVRAPLARR